MTQPSIICFGEVLWDLLPTGRIAGGAPMNVAFHAKQLGMSADLISKVGQDDLGNELRQFLAKKGLNTTCLATDYTFPTGTVAVTLDENGAPSYEIVQPVAWDYIHPEALVKDKIKQADAIVFGTLACRSARNLKTLVEYLSLAALRVLDVNLRPPFYTPNLVQLLLEQADIVKVNDEELDLIGDHNHLPLGERARMQALWESYELDVLILTKGKAGAICLDENGFHAHASFPVTVKDSIGSGDAFLAAFLSQHLRGGSPEQCLAAAGALGALVATHSGATPTINPDELEAMTRIPLLHTV